MTRLKEILGALRSCLALTVNARLVIILILTLFLLGLALRWRHLEQERSDPGRNASRDVPRATQETMSP